jgi:hypothetical protein
MKHRLINLTNLLHRPVETATLSCPSRLTAIANLDR